jgi:hypothetical protein
VLFDWSYKFLNVLEINIREICMYFVKSAIRNERLMPHRNDAAMGLRCQVLCKQKGFGCMKATALFRSCDDEVIPYIFSQRVVASICFPVIFLGDDQVYKPFLPET